MVERERDATEPDPSAGCEALGKLARESLRGAVSDEAHLGARARFVSALDARTAEPKGAAPRSVALRGWLALVQAAAVTLLVCALGAGLWSLRQPAPLEYVIEGPNQGTGTYLRSADSEVRVVFSEGSDLRLERETSAQLAEVTPTGARIVAHQGRVQARIKHLPQASWTVEAGPYAVRVTGTEFSVGWDASQSRLVVELYQGKLLVTGPQVPGGVELSAGRRLVGRAGGEALIVTDLRESAEDRSASGPSAAARAGSEAGAGGSGPSDASAGASDSPPASWQDQVAEGRFAEVVAEAEAEGIDAVLERRSLADLMALGDAARYMRRGDLAEKILQSERARFPTSAQATTAAFLLGRLAEARGAAGEAMQWYARYRVEAPGGALGEEALGRLLVLLQQNGQHDAARSAAKEYLASYPSGAFAKAARATLGEP